MIGKTISHFLITGELGGGGMGVVYRATDTDLDRPVALKFLPPELTRDSDAKRRFIHEARAASALQHNNICTIHEIGESDDGHIFIAMDCYEGETLKEKIARGPLPVAEAVDIAVQVATGLEKAHEAGMVHRDIKPANIMITRDGVVKLLDFGIAKLAGQTKVTKTGTTVGTVSYMSPEQVSGGDVDHRSDIWSLGIVLYEMLTGQVPFTGDHEAAVLYSIANTKPRTVTRYRDDIPDGLARIVNRALEKSPENRFENTEDLLLALKQVYRLIGNEGRTIRREGAAFIKRRAPWIVASVLLAVIALYVVWIQLDLSHKESSTIKSKKIAVLPFENLGSPEDEYFAAGMTEEITSRLAGIEELGVISRTSALQYGGSGKTIPEIGSDLGVEYVLEGTVRWDHRSDGTSRIRITPQLIRVSDDTHLWSDIYEQELVDVFAVQSEIAKKIIKQLDVTLVDRQRERLDARPTRNMEAYQAYSQGVYFEHRIAFSDEDKLTAQKMFERAIELDSTFALAYAKLSLLHSYIYFVRDRYPERQTAAKKALDNALRLEPDLPEAHLAGAAYYYRCRGDFDTARREIEIAMKSNPKDPQALNILAWIQSQTGDFSGALQTRLKAFELDPVNAELIMEIAYLYMALRDYARADEYWKRCLSIVPEYAMLFELRAVTCWLWHGDAKTARSILDRMPVTPQSKDPLWIFYTMYRQELYERNYDAALNRALSLPAEMCEHTPKSQLIGLAYYFKGDSASARGYFETARTELESEIKSYPDEYRFHSSLGIAYAALGRRDDAVREEKLAIELMSSNHPFYLGKWVTNLAFVYVLTGEYDAALDEIEKLLSMPTFFSTGLLELDPRWDPLRPHPRYASILAKYSKQSS